jgi:hypothetical protein
MSEMDECVFRQMKDELQTISQMDEAQRIDNQLSPLEVSIRQKVIGFLLENQGRFHFRYWIKGRLLKETSRKSTIGSLLPRSAKKLLLEVSKFYFITFSK